MSVDHQLLVASRKLLRLTDDERRDVLRELDAMERAVVDEAISYLLANPRRRWYCRRSVCDGLPHASMHWCEHPVQSKNHDPWCKHARTAQRPPTDLEFQLASKDGLPRWAVWLFSGGRGTGKTRAGAEWLLDGVWNKGWKRIALVARTPADCRDVMVEGGSGLLACSGVHPKPEYYPSLRRLIWPNGAMATTYTSFSADELRGPEHDAAWCDELAAWKDAAIGDKVDTTWSNLKLTMRIGEDPRICVTTTPKRIKLVRELWADPAVARTSGTTFENLDNMAETFRSQILDAYAGTRLERQELLGQLLVDVDGALWTLDSIDSGRIALEAESYLRNDAGLLVPSPSLVTTV